MLTVDYAFYVGAYLGARSEDEYQRLSLFASAFLSEITLGRIPDDPDRLGDPDAALRVRLAFCAVVDGYGDQEAARRGVSAESNDGISVSYVTDAALQRKSLYEAAAVYLAPTGLLYRGVV